MNKRLVRTLTASAIVGAAFVAVPSSVSGVSTANAECVAPATNESGVTPLRAAEIERDLRSRLASRPAAAAGPITVSVVFHVVHRTDGRGNLPQAAVTAQIARLNKDFSGQEAPGTAADTGFRFQLTATRRWQNNEWFDNGINEDISGAMRTQTREGTFGTLNIWSVDLAGNGGAATFPWDSQASRPKDGVRIDWTRVPGGSHPEYNKGMTASHEAGHWLGLWHTHEFGCEFEGDYVTDTPAHYDQPKEGCEEFDTCPAPGTDPLHNYMAYWGDACRNQFTAGQGVRAREHWSAYRA